MTNYDQLPAPLQRILDFIRAYADEHGFAPSVREIGSAAGIPSTSTVHAHLRRLEEAGFLRRDPAKPRAMVIQKNRLENAPGVSRPGDALKGFTGQSERPFLGGDYLSLPFVPFTDIADVFTRDEPGPADAVDPPWLIPSGVLKEGAYFLTVMPDDSMSNRQLAAGDYLIVRQQNTANNNDMIVGRLNQETLIRIYTKGLRQIRLQVEGDNFVVVTVDPEELTIYGVVTGLLHSLA